MNSFLLQRSGHKAYATYGMIYVFNDHLECVQELHTLELPWRGNRKGESCIPEGEYVIKKRVSDKYGEHLIVLDPEHLDHPYPRTFILFHPANYVSELRGCIAPGMNKIDINGDGIVDVTNSRKAMQVMLDCADGDVNPLIIID